MASRTAWYAEATASASAALVTSSPRTSTVASFPSAFSPATVRRASSSVAPAMYGADRRWTTGRGTAGSRRTIARSTTLTAARFYEDSVVRRLRIGGNADALTARARINRTVRRIVIMGAGGRDFHDFNTVFREDDSVDVVAFTAAQIPGIDGRTYPPSLAGTRYPEGIPIRPEAELAEIVRAEGVDTVVLSYSDLSHEEVMHKASRVLAAGADFHLLGPQATMLEATLPVIAVTAVRTGCGKSPTSRRIGSLLRAAGHRVG